ncbi:MAG TPA: pyrimidine 5'-nucleotidase [Burkholderiales bacterium]|nr:pyrimidine 5'-nucleotidase [Burkholderiales bacterium]
MHSESGGSRVWIFDLDNTLHDADPHIFPHINRSMTEYVARHLGVDEQSANHLRDAYWRRYGATLLGLIRHHDVDPAHFLQETHRFPDISKMVVGRRGLRHVLRRLPGRKFVFSNAPAHYIELVLGVLGVRDLFDDVFSIERTRFRPKPQAHGFLRLMREHRLVASRCIMVEDSLENLHTARRLGMTTVWVGASGCAPAWVDASVRHLFRLPRLLHRLRGAC